MNFGYFRKKSGLTQRQMADALECSQSAIAAWEIKTREPNIETMCKMADIFGITVDELVGHNPQVDANNLNEIAIIKEFQKLTLEQQQQVIEYARFIQKKF